MAEKQILTVLNVGLVFFFTFTAFGTLQNVEKTLLSSVQDDDDHFKADGYTSLGILFLAYATFMWFVPSVIDYLGLKRALVAGPLLYLIFLSSFLTYSTWYVYVASAVAGIAGSVTWTAGGTLVTKTSDESTIIRNLGIFLIMYSASLLGGNIFEYIQFQGLKHLDHSVRTTLVLVLMGFAACGVVSALILRPPKGRDEKTSVGAMKAIQSTLALLKRHDMQFMCVPFFYSGLYIAFATGVYSPSVGSTLQLESPKSLIGLSGVFMGVGGLLGSIFMFIYSTASNRWDRRVRILCYAVVHAIPLILTFINLPNGAPQGDTYGEAIISSSSTLAMTSSLFLGMGVTLTNSISYDNIEFMFKENHTGAVSIYNFFLSFGSSLSFFYSTYVGLHTLLGILLFLLISSTICMFVAVAECSKRASEKLNNILP